MQNYISKKESDLNSTKLSLISISEELNEGQNET